MLSIIEFKINRKLKKGEIVEAFIESLNYIIESNLELSGYSYVITEGKEELRTILLNAQKDIENLKSDLNNNLDITLKHFQDSLKNYLSILLKTGTQPDSYEMPIKTEAAIRRVAMTKGNLFTLIDKYLGQFKEIFTKYINGRVDKFNSDFITKALQDVAVKKREKATPDATEVPTVAKKQSPVKPLEEPKTTPTISSSKPLEEPKKPPVSPQRTIEDSFKQALEIVKNSDKRRRIPVDLLKDIANDPQMSYSFAVELLNLGKRSIPPEITNSMKQGEGLYQKFTDYENQLKEKEEQQKEEKRKKRYLARLQKKAQEMEQKDKSSSGDLPFDEPSSSALEPEIPQSEEPEPEISKDSLFDHINDDNFDKIKKLLDDHGKEISKDTLNNVLDIAAKNGHEKIVELLIDAGATKLTKALLDSVINNHKKVVEVLLEKGKFDSKEINHAKGYAETYRHYEIVSLLNDVYKKLKKTEKATKSSKETTEEKPAKSKRKHKKAIKPSSSSDDDSENFGDFDDSILDSLPSRYGKI